MKKLFLELAVLGVAFAACIYILEKKYRAYQAPTDEVMSIYKQQKDSISTVMLGNSHTIALGEPSIFNGKTYNMAFSGISLFDFFALTKNVIAKTPATKNIIIGLDYDLIGLSGERSILTTQLFRFTDSLQVNSLGNRLKARSNYFRSGQDFKFLLGAGSSSNVHGKNAPAQRNFIPVNFKSRNDLEGCRRRALEHGSNAFLSSNIQQNIRLLDTLIKFGKEHKINIVFICAPKTKCYLQTYLSLASIKKSKLILDSVFKSHNTPYFDMVTDSAFNDDDFIDFDHLTPSGATKLVRILKENILKTNDPLMLSNLRSKTD